MTVTKFDYIAPKTIQEAVKILAQKGKDASIMAGGTDLLVKIHRQLVSPKLVVGIKKIPDMDLIHFDKTKGLSIGATALLSTVATHEKILKYFPTIAMAAKSTANTQVRNMGTIVGNICNGSPSADNAPILLAMATILNIAGPSGNRTIELENFFIGPGSIALNTGEFVTSAFIPIPQNSYGTAYCHISQRGEMDCSAIGVGTMLIISKGTFKNIRIFVGACAPTPVRAVMAEQMLKGAKIDDTLIHEASLQASREASPISDLRASSDYRKKMISIMARKAIINAKRMATSK